MFITEEDYRVVVGENALKVISRTSAENRTNAEHEAQGKIVPDLPVVTDENGEIANGSFIYGCQKKQRYNW